MCKLIYQLPADYPDSIRAAAFPNPLEEKLNRIGLRCEHVSPIIHSFVDTICLGVVFRKREIILDSPIDVTTATLRRWIWMVSNFHQRWKEELAFAIGVL